MYLGCRQLWVDQDAAVMYINNICHLHLAYRHIHLHLRKAGAGSKGIVFAVACGLCRDML